MHYNRGGGTLPLGSREALSAPGIRIGGSLLRNHLVCWPRRNSDLGVRPTMALVRDHGEGLGFPRSCSSIERYGWSHSLP